MRLKFRKTANFIWSIGQFILLTLRVKNTVHNHKGKPHVAGRLHTARTYFSIKAYKQTTVSSGSEQSEVNSLLSATPGRGIKA